MNTLTRIRAWLLVFAVGLVISGLTAFPLVTETRLLADLLHAVPAPDALVAWVDQAHEGLTATGRDYPFIAYGTDWLAFAHLVIAIAFQAGLNPTDVACHVLTHNNRHAARTATQAYLDSADTIDAIIAFSDEIALGARDALTRHRRAIPSHVSITGFDDSAEAEAAELTTIAQDLQSQGRLCAAIALGERIAANGAAPWRLVIRNSTRA